MSATHAVPSVGRSPGADGVGVAATVAVGSGAGSPEKTGCGGRSTFDGRMGAGSIGCGAATPNEAK
jgi:hypothetical protein